MTPEELKALLDQIKGQMTPAIKTEVNDAIKGLVSADQLAEKLEAVGLKSGVIEGLNTAIAEQGMELRKLLNPEGKTIVKTMAEILNEKKAEIIGLADGSQRSVKLNIPIKTIATTASVGSSTIGQRLAEIGQVPYLGAVMSQLFRHAPVEAGMNKTIRYLDQTTVTRNAAGRAETTGAGVGTFGESAIAWTEYSFNIPEIGDSIPVSKEAFRFLSFVQAEIDRLLNTNIALIEDAYYWDGTGTAPISKGVYAYASAFAAATYAAASGSWLPEKANLYDLAMVLQEQISNGYQSKYQPDLLIVNPGDMIAMRGTKDANGNYIQHPLLAGNSLNGMEIVQSSQVDKNTLLVCDRRFATIYDAEDLTIEMGHVGNQFKEGAMTLRAYKSTGILVRNADTGAFLKSTDITGDIADINAVTA